MFSWSLRGRTAPGIQTVAHGKAGARALRPAPCIGAGADCGALGYRGRSLAPAGARPVRAESWNGRRAVDGQGERRRLRPDRAAPEPCPTYPPGRRDGLCVAAIRRRMPRAMCR
jgi:hypothetical protein